jgi:hypothetical protein
LLLAGLLLWGGTVEIPEYDIPDEGARGLPSNGSDGNESGLRVRLDLECDRLSAILERGASWHRVLSDSTN